MLTMTMRFAHTLLFFCSDCQQPIPISRTREEKNLEGIDSELLTICCSHCKQTTTVKGLMATKHYVDEWP
jgi:hypothetical protein